MWKHKTVLKKSQEVRPPALVSGAPSLSFSLLLGRPARRTGHCISGLAAVFVVQCLQLTLGSVTFAVWFVHPGGGPPRKNPRWSCFNLWHHLCLCVGSKGCQGCKDPLPPLSVSDCGQESWLASSPSPLHTEWVSACGGLNFPSGGLLPLWRVFA